jgi:hypothetical protein
MTTGADVAGPEMWTTTQAAAYLGASSAGSARKILSRLGIRAIGRQPGRDGENLYDAAQIRKARSPRPAPSDPEA